MGAPSAALRAEVTVLLTLPAATAGHRRLSVTSRGRAGSDVTVGVCERGNKLSGQRPASTRDSVSPDRGTRSAAVSRPVRRAPAAGRRRPARSRAAGRRRTSPGSARRSCASAPASVVMSTSSYVSPSSAQTASTTARASSHRWQPGLGVQHAPAAVRRSIGPLIEQPQRPAPLGGAQPSLGHLAGHRVRAGRRRPATARGCLNRASRCGAVLADLRRRAASAAYASSAAGLT